MTGKPRNTYGEAHRVWLRLDQNVVTRDHTLREATTSRARESLSRIGMSGSGLCGTRHFSSEDNHDLFFLTMSTLGIVQRCEQLFTEKQLTYYVVHAKSFLVLGLNDDGSCIDSISFVWRLVISFHSTCLIYLMLVLDHSAHYDGVPRSAERSAHADHRPRHVATRSDNAREPEELGGLNGNLDYSKHAKHFYCPL